MHHFESELLYDWQFTSNLFVLVPSPLRLMTSNFFFTRTLAVIVFMQHPFWREVGSVVYNCCWPSPVQSCLGPSPTGFMTTFYSLRFENLPTWRVRSPYFYPQGTGWPSYTTRHWAPFLLPPMTHRASVKVFEPTSTRGASFWGESWQLLYCDT
jgi:hypothetical protein